MKTQTLFGEITPDVRISAKELQRRERRRKMKIAYEAAAPAWKEAFKKFAVTIFLPQREFFIWEELSDAYDEIAKMYGLPQTPEKRANGPMCREFITEGLIEPTEMTRRSYESNKRTVYRSRLVEGGE